MTAFTVVSKSKCIQFPKKLMKQAINCIVWSCIVFNWEDFRKLKQINTFMHFISPTVTFWVQHHKYLHGEAFSMCSYPHINDHVSTLLLTAGFLAHTTQLSSNAFRWHCVNCKVSSLHRPSKSEVLLSCHVDTDPGFVSVNSEFLNLTKVQHLITEAAFQEN